MRTLILLSVLVMVAGLISCSKSGSNSGMSSKTKNTTVNLAFLEGDWKLVSDSNTWSIGPDFVQSASGYAGTPADFYSFTANGMLYARDGAQTDTATYALTSNAIKLQYEYMNGKNVTGLYASTYYIQELTANRAVIADTLLSPGGPMVRKITLGK